MNKKNEWKTDLKLIEECSMVEEPKIKFSLLALGKVSFLLEKFEDEEWACDLIGFYDEENNEYVIEDIYIFEQEISYSSVERIEEPCEGAIGVLHSHHSMGSFFSGTDEEFPNSNYNVSGVVDSDMKFKFSVRVKTPCGVYKRFITDGVSIYIEKVEIPSHALKKIKKEKPKVVFANGEQYFYEFPVYEQKEHRKTKKEKK